MKKIKLITAFLMMQIFCIGQIIHVPIDQPTIQAAIDAAIHSDTILVEDGTYYENINFKGKAIMVASHFLIDGDEDHIDNTIIDGSQFTNPDSASTVMFINGEDTTSVICGFTITGGSGVVVTTPWQAIMGGGIFTSNSGAKITNNHITNNMLTHANYSCGGVGIGSFSTTEIHWIVISDNVISDNQSFANSVSSFGGGIYVMNNAMIKNNVIEQNSCYNSGAQADGGGIEAEQVEGQDFTVYLDNNLIQNNSVEGTTYGLGGGISCLSISTIYILNNTIAENILLSGNLGFGGGIYATNVGDLIQIKNNTIGNNSCDATSSYGGGFSLIQCGISIVTENEISSNSLIAENYSGGGGGYFQQATDTIFISKNNFDGNITGGTGFGGGIGIYNTTFDVLYFDGNILSNNYSTQNGGGLWTFNTYRTNITNNVFDNNEANGVGGAVSFRQYLGKGENIIFPNSFTKLEKGNVTHDRDDNLHPIIANNNFISNNANRGGAIDSDHGMETPIIFNSIFLNNSAPLGQDLYNYSDSALFVYNNDIDIEDISGTWEGIGNIFEDPLFIDPVNGNFHLNNCLSPCINRGVDSLEIGSAWYYCPTTDMDNETRPYANTFPDIGADETPCLETSIKDNEAVTSSSLCLNNVPNPFSRHTTIQFTLPNDAIAILSVFDITGKHLKTILSKKLSKGNHKINWNAEGLNEGIYFIRLETTNGIQTRKMIKLK